MCIPLILLSVVILSNVYSARSTGLKDSMFVNPNTQDSVKCPDQCHSVVYTSRVSESILCLVRFYLEHFLGVCSWLCWQYKLLHEQPPLPAKEKWTILHGILAIPQCLYCLMFSYLLPHIQDTFTKTWDKTDWNRTVLGVPVGQKDPRFSSSP